MVKQELAQVNPKFHAGPNELEQEPELKILQPTNAEQLKQLTALVETLIRQKRGDQAWLNALRLWQMQITTGALSDQVKFQFVRRFYFWLLGRGTKEDVERTIWGRANVAVLNREVALYIEQFSQRRLDYALQLSLLAMRVPSTLNGYYLYFKYIVNGKLKRSHDRTGGSWWELSDDDYLQDFDMFQQEFDKTNNEPTYKDLIRPAAQRGNQPPFDASRPYPASAQANESNRLPTKTNEEIVDGVLKQENELPNEPLPDAMDTDEDGMDQSPVGGPQPNAQPVPVNLEAMGVAPAPIINIDIGEQFAPYIAAQREQTQTIGRLTRELGQLKKEQRAQEIPRVEGAIEAARRESVAIFQELSRQNQRISAEALEARRADQAMLRETMQLLQQQARATPTSSAVHNAAADTRRAEVYVEELLKRWGPPPPPPGAAPAQVVAQVDLSRLETALLQQGERTQQSAREVLRQFASEMVRIGGNAAETLAQVRQMVQTMPKHQETANTVQFADPRLLDKMQGQIATQGKELLQAQRAAQQQEDRAVRAEAAAQQAAAAVHFLSAEQQRAQQTARHQEQAAKKAEYDRKRAELRQQQAQAAADLEHRARVEREQAALEAHRVAAERRKADKAAAAARKEERRLMKEEAAKQKLAQQMVEEDIPKLVAELEKEKETKRPREEEVEASAPPLAEAIGAENTKSELAAKRQALAEAKARAVAGETEEATRLRLEAAARLEMAAERNNAPSAPSLGEAIGTENTKAELKAKREALQQARIANAAAAVGTETEAATRLRLEAEARLEMAQERALNEAVEEETLNDARMRVLEHKAVRVGIIKRRSGGRKSATVEDVQKIERKLLQAQSSTFRAQKLQRKRVAK